MAHNADQRTGVFDGKPSYTIPQAAAQLGREGLSWSDGLGKAATVTYAYRASAPGMMIEDTSGFSQFSSLQIDATERALAAWSAIAGITFVRKGSGQGGSNAYSDDATILFGNYNAGAEGAAAFAILPGSIAGGSAAGDVWVNASLAENRELGPEQYGYATLLHEIGHAIGLAHPSNYDAIGDNGSTLTYRRDASYYEDSLQYTVMSYFAASETGSDVEDRSDGPSTPLIDDIAAAQRLYGTNPQGNAGDTRYNMRWGAIFDASGVDTLDYGSWGGDQTIDLRPGNFSDVAGSHGNLAISSGTMIENASGGSGDDMIIGNDANNRLVGGGGNDVLRGGLGQDTYVGDHGNDRAIVGGNVWDYRLLDGGSAGLILESTNGSGSSWIGSSIETIQFQNGQYLSLSDVHAYVQAIASNTFRQLMAPIEATVRIAGGPGQDRLFIDGNVGDYTVVRGLPFAGTSEIGDFILLNSRGGSQIVVGQDVDQIEFRNGQYLSLSDLGSYIPGNVSLPEGSSQNDLLFQVKDSGFQMYAGNAGYDTLYVKGNTNDYTVAYFTGSSAPAGDQRSGFALVAHNGSGIQFIDTSVERVQFQNGQYLSLNDLPAYVQAEGNDLTGVRVFNEGVSIVYNDVVISSSTDTLYLDGKVEDYFIDRTSYTGGYIFQRGTQTLRFSQELATVHFENGQYITMDDIQNYTVTGSYTSGNSADDLLWAKLTGDQLLIGREGIDNAYLHGNVNDYSLKQFTRVDPVYHEGGTYISGFIEVTGYQLVAKNGSGKIDIDPTTEVVHFQNGQYLSFGDLSAYIFA